MAVGIDYTLFYLRREREERAKGATVTEALRIAAGPLTATASASAGAGAGAGAPRVRA